ncbi:hypothetical protein CsatB_017728 [Cannabis sativa]
MRAVSTLNCSRYILCSLCSTSPLPLAALFDFASPSRCSVRLRRRTAAQAVLEWRVVAAARNRGPSSLTLFYPNPPSAFDLCYYGEFKRFGGGDSGCGFASDGFNVGPRS